MKYSIYLNIIIVIVITINSKHGPAEIREYHTHQEAFIPPPIHAETMVTNSTSPSETFTINSNKFNVKLI